ncbi:hypothetical protein [Thermomonas sp.]
MDINHTSAVPAETSPGHASQHERSPLEFPCGVFIADTPGFGGAQGFHWFEDDLAVVEFLRNDQPSLYEDDASELRALTTAIGEALVNALNVKAINLVALNAALDGLCDVRWVGSLDDLYIGKGAFEREIQMDFHENVFGDERGFTKSDYEDFAWHLENYTA